MKRVAILASAAVFSLTASFSALAEGAAHKVAIQVDEADPAVMNLALNNAKNVASYFKEKGETVAVEIVAYGPGLMMYTADSPVKDRISEMSLANDNMQFSACGNTMAAMEKKTGKKPELLSEAKVVTSGVVRLMELQEDGYSYVRP